MIHELSRTEHNLRRSVFENIFDNFCVIIGNGEFNHTGVKCRGGQNHRQISKNINLPTMEKMPNVAVDAEEEKNDGNPDFQEFKTEEKKSKAERKSEKHYHFNNCTFNFKEPQ